MSEASSAEKGHLHHDGGIRTVGGAAPREDNDLAALGYKQELNRNRSVYTILFQVLAITAVPFGEGTALTSAIIGGGQLAYFVGWIVVVILDQCVAVSLSEIASKFPTSSGPYYWTYQLLPEGRARTIASFITGWVWLIGNLTICLSVNFGTASLLAGTATIYHPDWFASDWQLLLIFYAVCIATFLVCAFGNRVLPYVDTVASVWNGLTILIVCIALSVVADAGRHSAGYALANYDKSFSGWGNFTFFIGLLPAAYTFAAIGMITSMAEEVADPSKDVPNALSLVVPISGIAGLFFILPICFTMPPLEDVLNAPAAQAMPYIFHTVMGTPGGGLALMFFLLGVAVFCCISITTAASRTTWAMARDQAIPLSSMLLGLINLGSTSAFTAFASCGVIALAAAYAIPIGISLFGGRKAVSTARWRCPALIGYVVNVVSVGWIGFQLVLFSMPAALPVTVVSMNYASVVFVGFMFISLLYYVAYGRRVYHGPPASDGL
ncbi:putative amino-acid permease [Cyphellophora attinorum]|uniref:Putative amino-acid permease n=1 Tax=Cyphellophora attinorum TaxID=1664694 RepID=A0A0N1NY37_9EURO|nr:putative amino-acid permease [Phialophora attinorum]KPI36336.1 putative amino-acid permease [Phialophora attinorum]